MYLKEYIPTRVICILKHPGRSRQSLASLYILVALLCSPVLAHSLACSMRLHADGWVWPASGVCRTAVRRLLCRSYQVTWPPSMVICWEGSTRRREGPSGSARWGSSWSSRFIAKHFRFCPGMERQAGRIVLAVAAQQWSWSGESSSSVVISHSLIISALNSTFLLFLRTTERFREDYDIAVAMLAPPQVGLEMILHEFQ